MKVCLLPSNLLFPSTLALLCPFSQQLCIPFNAADKRRKDAIPQTGIQNNLRMYLLQIIKNKSQHSNPRLPHPGHRNRRNPLPPALAPRMPLLHPPNPHLQHLPPTDLESASRPQGHRHRQRFLGTRNRGLDAAGPESGAGGCGKQGCVVDA